MKAFTLALESMQRPAFTIGQIPPTPEIVNQYFNDSTGNGDEGDADARGPWNEGNGWEVVDAPAFQDFRARGRDARSMHNGAEAAAPDSITESLVDGLRDLLHAETQLTKALPK